MAPSAGSRTYAGAVSAWADHLRSGGTTPWWVWVEEEHPAARALHPLPDAVHLELVRRLNLAGGEDAAGLFERILAIASPGRGLVDVPLPWPEAPPRFGTPAIDPGRLPVEELIRLAVGVLVHLLPEVPPRAPGPEPHPWPMPWRRRFRLHGSPGTAAGLRRVLLAQGLVETDRRPTDIVVARPVEVMMAEHWAANTRAGGIVKWSTLWRRAEATGRLPGRIDVASVAERLLDRQPERARRRGTVHVVVAREAEDAAALAARVLGARHDTVARGVDQAQTDLLRRVNRLTALTEGPARVRDLVVRLDAALAGLPDLPGQVPPPVVPAAARSWAEAQAAATADRLRAAGYAVHGDLDALAPSDQRLPGTVDRTRTLELALAACLRTWRLQGGPP